MTLFSKKFYIIIPLLLGLIFILNILSRFSPAIFSFINNNLLISIQTNKNQELDRLFSTSFLTKGKVVQPPSEFKNTGHLYLKVKLDSGREVSLLLGKPSWKIGYGLSKSLDENQPHEWKTDQINAVTAHLPKNTPVAFHVLKSDVFDNCKNQRCKEFKTVLINQEINGVISQILIQQL